MSATIKKIHYIVLPNQLFRIGHFIPIPDVIFIYCHKKLYTVNKVPISAVKRKYMDACVKEYVNYLKNIKISYKIVESLEKPTASSIIYSFDPVDHEIEAEYKKIGAFILDTPQFMLTQQECATYVANNKKNGKMPNMGTFYKYIRTKLNIFIKNGEPLFGSWSLDAENRLPLPTNYKSRTNAEITRIISFPTNHKDAASALRQFIKTRLQMFGPYQDAIAQDPVIYHSALSPMINNGLILPLDILNLFKKVRITKDNASSLEGYLRQLIGWREYMRVVYVAFGKEQPSNQFRALKRLPKSWYMSEETKYTEISLVDAAIHDANNTGYLHHIRRLMVVGCFMFMSGILPKDANTWFITQFLDGYEWVMHGNVYFMSQFTSATITRRPYICSSSYLIKMMHDKNNFDKESQKKWDEIYIEFVRKNKSALSKFYMMFPHIKKIENII
jgi:deoxyribodipyrimidine photolyase-related protein